MNRHQRILIMVLASGLIAGWLGHSRGQEKPAPAENKSQSDTPEMAAVKKTAEELAKAFNAGDAKAVAAFWTKEGEFVDIDGESTQGREQIEKVYADFFKQHPKATVEIDAQSVRLLGRHTALEEGSLKLRLPGDQEPRVSRYSILHVREDDGWRMASVREWAPDAQELVTLKDVDWLLGEWKATSEDAELRMTYSWDEDKAFLRGRYVLTREGKAASGGTQIIGKNPGGGLRSWVFDSSGSYSESVWSRDDNRWVIDASGTLPDGNEVTAFNILIPLGKDAFTWQSVERTAAGSALPDLPPIRVTRAAAQK